MFAGSFGFIISNECGQGDGEQERIASGGGGIWNIGTSLLKRCVDYSHISFECVCRNGQQIKFGPKNSSDNLYTYSYSRNTNFNAYSMRAQSTRHGRKGRCKLFMNANSALSFCPILCQNRFCDFLNKRLLLLLHGHSERN